MELYENDKKLCDVEVHKGGKIPIGQQFGQSAALETVQEIRLISPVMPNQKMGTVFYLVKADMKCRINIHEIGRRGDKYILSVSLQQV
jgi:hypothetical protein